MSSMQLPILRPSLIDSPKVLANTCVGDNDDRKRLFWMCYDWYPYRGDHMYWHSPTASATAWPISVNFAIDDNSVILLLSKIVTQSAQND